jgi:uncharacterized protein
MNNEKLSPAELKNKITSFLSEHIDGALATCMNNIPRSSPVQYFMGDDMNIYILSAGGDKFNAIEQNPNVCLLVNTEYIAYRKIKGVQIFGKATTSMQDSSLKDEARKFAPDLYLFDKEKNNLNVIKIVPKEIVYLDSLREGDRTKQILKDDEVTIKEDYMMMSL